MRFLIFVLVFAMLALPALAQRGEFAEPAGAELSQFPIKTAPLTLAQQAELGLSAKRLDNPVVVQNHFRNIRNGRFVLETLPAGTLVLVDKNGTLRYKADCGNRLVEPVNCLQCHKLALGGDRRAKGEISPKSSTPFKEWLKRGWEGMGQLLGLMLGALLPLLGLLALLAVLGLLGYALYRLFQSWRNDGGNNPPPPMNPRPAPVAPMPPAPAPMPVAPPPAPIPVMPPPAPPVGFPNRRAIVDFGGRNSATRIQAGSEISRVEFERNADGSASVRIFES